MNNLSIDLPELIQDLLLNKDFNKFTLARRLEIGRQQLNDILYGKIALENEAKIFREILSLMR